MKVSTQALPADDQRLLEVAGRLADSVPAPDGSGFAHSVELKSSPVAEMDAEVCMTRGRDDQAWGLSHVILFGDRLDGGPEQYFCVGASEVIPAFWIHEDSSEADTAAAQVLTEAFLAGTEAGKMLELRARVRDLVEADRHGNPSLETFRAAHTN